MCLMCPANSHYRSEAVHCDLFWNFDCAWRLKRWSSGFTTERHDVIDIKNKRRARQIKTRNKQMGGGGWQTIGWHININGVLMAGHASVMCHLYALLFYNYSLLIKINRNFIDKFFSPEILSIRPCLSFEFILVMPRGKMQKKGRSYSIRRKEIKVLIALPSFTRRGRLRMMGWNADHQIRYHQHQSRHHK